MMTREDVIAIQRQIGIPESWKQPEPSRHFLSGRNFNAEFKGRIVIEYECPGWIHIHTCAGSMVVKDQIISCDGSAL